MSEKIEKYLAQGQEIDTWISKNQFSEASQSLADLLQKVRRHKAADSYLLSKVTLSALYLATKQGQWNQAFEIWNAPAEDHVFGLGIYGLEHAQTSVDDLVLYDLLCAFLHSISDAPKETAAHNVNQYLSRVCEKAMEESDFKLLKQTLNNWKIHLREIFKGTIPSKHIQSLIQFEKVLQEPVRTEPLFFPKPDLWKKHDYFSEMSKIIELRTREKQTPQFHKQNSKSLSKHGPKKFQRGA